MKACFFLFLAATSLLGGQVAGAADAEATWKIERLSVAPVKEGVRLLTASIVHVSDFRKIELSDDVAVEKIREAFIWRDRLVLLGEAERASVVEIFDLGRKAKVDRFVCYQPRRISDNWIAYKEFFHGSAQGPVVPIEVLLVYDLAKTPQENRMDKGLNQKIPPPLDDNAVNVVDVGIPIYPESNARQRSYQIIFEKQNAGRSIDAGTFALLPSKKLVFSCVEMQPGMGWIGARQYLVVVDLSRGLESPPSRMADFPKMGEYGTTIEKIEAEPPNAVRLVFPAGQYSVNSLVVELPVF
jgi:hypothetical protein